MTDKCPNCQSKLKSFFDANKTLSEQENTELLNRVLEKQSDAYCSQCIPGARTNALSIITSKIDGLNKQISDIIPNVQILTTHTPPKWDFDVIEMVTAQSVTGTGVVTEVVTSWTDFFGMQSNRMNDKLKNGEEVCKNIIRYKALKLGGHAIIATDIDYAEVGGGKGMLMVCMSGTVVKINNFEQIDFKRSEQIKTINHLFDEIEALSKDKKLVAKLPQY